MQRKTIDTSPKVTPKHLIPQMILTTMVATMIDLSQYDNKSTSAAGRLRDFIKDEVGHQPFCASQLVRAVMDIDPWFGKRDAESVRWAVNDVIRNMVKAGKLEVVGGEKRRRMFMLVGGEK